MKYILLLFILLPSFLFSQNIEIEGKILGLNENESIPFASVRINGINGTADEAGFFLLSVPKSDMYTLDIRSIGYSEFTTNYHSNELQNIVVYLMVEPITTEEVLVVASMSSPFAKGNYDQDKTVSQPKNVGDLFRNLNGFTVQKKGGYAMEPIFRAFKKEELNILYDGYIQLTHACPNRMDPGMTHVIPEEVKKIEMITGPFSVKYGPTFGGIINIVTESPANFKKGLSGSAEIGYDFNGQGKTSRIMLGSAHEKFDFYINGGVKDFGDYQDGKGNIVPSHFRSYDYAVKSGVKLSQNQRLQFQFRQSFGRDISHAGLPMDSPYDNSTVGAISYKIKNVSPKIIGFEAKAYGTYVDHLMSNEERPNFVVVEAESPVMAKTFGAKTEINLASSDRNNISVGLEYRYLGRDGARTRFLKKNPKTKEDLPSAKTFTDKIWQNSLIKTSSFYFEDKYFINSTWQLLSGIRMDYVTSDIKDPAKDFEQLYDLEHLDSELNVSGTASLSYTSKRNWKMALAIGRGVRAATLEERYINHFSIGRDPYELVGNPNLKPEANHQIELSFAKNIGDIKWSTNIFYSYITDYITPGIDTSIKRKYLPFKEPKFAKRFQNIDNVTQVGFEVGIDYQLTKGLDFSAQVAYTHAKNIDWDEPLSQVAPLELKLGGNYEAKIWWVNLNSRIVRKQDRFSTQFGEGETPGFALVDINFGIRPIDNLTFGFGVSNLFDTNYYEHLNWSFTNLKEYKGSIHERGRNISLFAKYVF